MSAPETAGLGHNKPPAYDHDVLATLEGKVLEAERKQARDARYAARKNRK